MLLFHNEPVIHENIITKILFASCLAKISYHKNFRIYGTQKVFLWNAWNVLTRMSRSIKDTFCSCVGRDDQITTSAQLFDIIYESYEFGADLIETIN